MASRYALDPADAWHEASPNGEDWHGDVRTFVRDVVERVNGTVVRRWSQGAWQVRGAGPTRTFIGESAWADCAREAHDRVLRVAFGR